MRVVFDTNVLISALLFENSLPAQAFFSAISKGEVLISTALVNEVFNVLSRPKFDQYINGVQRGDKQGYWLTLQKRSMFAATQKIIWSLN